MSRKRYPSDITLEQFAKIAPILELARKRTSPRTLDLYHVFNTIFYLLKTGCQWRQMPTEYPKWRSVHAYFQIWQEDETLSKVLKRISWRGLTKQWTDCQN